MTYTYTFPLEVDTAMMSTEISKMLSCINNFMAPLGEISLRTTVGKMTIESNAKLLRGQIEVIQEMSQKAIDEKNLSMKIYVGSPTVTANE